MSDAGGLWDDAEVVSRYTDAQAVEDGVLVAVSRRDRVTAAVWAFLKQALPERQPPSYWPIDLIGWCRAQTPDDRALAASRGLIDVHRAQAQRAHDTDDYPFRLWADVVSGPRIVRLCTVKPENPHAETLWLAVNHELGEDAITLMLPSDW